MKTIRIRDRAIRTFCLCVAGPLLGLFVLGVCKACPQEPARGPIVVAAAGGGAATLAPEHARIRMTIGPRCFAITLTDSPAARAFAARLPLDVDLAELNGNEKHGKLSRPLPTNARRLGAIRDGDVMLYGADTLVVFYMTFDSPYSYTRLGRVDDPASLAQALGGSNVRVRFSSPPIRQ